MKNDIINMYNKYIINPIGKLFLKQNSNSKEIDEMYLRTLQNIEKSISEDLEILHKKKKLAD